MNTLPNSTSILEIEGDIDALLNHHRRKYRYRGEPGGEYRVIAGIFNELNKIAYLENKHIQWYAAINHLIFLSRTRRLTQDSNEISLLTSDVVFRKIAGSTSHPKPFFVPTYIDLLESYITGISRFGVFLSSTREKDKSFFEFRLGEITRKLKRLLHALGDGSEQPVRESVYHLTINNATDNMIFHCAYLKKKSAGNLKMVKESELFAALITRKIKNINQEIIGRFYQMDDFWNGLIP